MDITHKLQLLNITPPSDLKDPIVFIAIETTHTDSRQAEIIEIAIAITDG